MRILLAIDGSSFSQAAIDEVCTRPWPPDSEVRIITVDKPMNPESKMGSPSAWDEINKQLRIEAIQRLHDAEAHFKQHAQGLRYTAVLLEGWPKDVILDEADRWGADLIVVGSHGYGAMRRVFLGSVSLAVATNALCSVEIVRRRPESSTAATAES